MHLLCVRREEAEAIFEAGREAAVEELRKNCSLVRSAPSGKIVQQRRVRGAVGAGVEELFVRSMSWSG